MEDEAQAFRQDTDDDNSDRGKIQCGYESLRTYRTCRPHTSNSLENKSSENNRLNAASHGNRSTGIRKNGNRTVWVASDAEAREVRISVSTLKKRLIHSILILRLITLCGGGTTSIRDSTANTPKANSLCASNEGSPARTLYHRKTTLRTRVNEDCCKDSV